jgi:hypothetical protein
MWVVRQYDRTSDELSFEQALPGLRGEDAARVLGFTPTTFGSTPLGPEHVAVLVDRFGFRGTADADDALESFLDFDAAPEPTERVRAGGASARRR